MLPFPTKIFPLATVFFPNRSTTQQQYRQTRSNSPSCIIVSKAVVGGTVILEGVVTQEVIPTPPMLTGRVYLLIVINAYNQLPMRGMFLPHVFIAFVINAPNNNFHSFLVVRFVEHHLTHLRMSDVLAQPTMILRNMEGGCVRFLQNNWLIYFRTL
jgi:hypothetical protein